MSDNLPDDLFSVLFHCQDHPSPWQALLAYCIALQRPLLALLADCYPVQLLHNYTCTCTCSTIVTYTYTCSTIVTYVCMYNELDALPNCLVGEVTCGVAEGLGSTKIHVA